MGHQSSAAEVRDTVIAAVDTDYEPLTAENTALLLVDHQIGPLWELEFASTRRAVVMLASMARREGVPAIITAIAPTTWGAIIPELTEVLHGAPHIVRRTVNAWEEASVRSSIEQSGRRKLIIAGGTARAAVTLCALSAARAGYTVYTPLDASAQFSHPEITLLSRGGVIVTTTSLIEAELAPARTRRGLRSRARPR